MDPALRTSYWLGDSRAGSLGDSEDRRSGVALPRKPALCSAFDPAELSYFGSVLVTLGLKIVPAEPSVSGSISLLKRIAAVAELKAAPVKKVNNLSAFLHPMSVPWRENKIEGIWLPKKDKRCRRDAGRCWADREQEQGRQPEGLDGSQVTWGSDRGAASWRCRSQGDRADHAPLGTAQQGVEERTPTWGSESPEPKTQPHRHSCHPVIFCQSLQFTAGPFAPLKWANDT